MWIIWLAVFVLALIIEAASAELLSIWFALGSLIAIILSFIPGVEWWIQLIVFLVISIAALFCLRPLMSKMMKRTQVKSNVDEMIHKKGKMVKTYDEFNHGEVRINGVVWTAIGSDEKETIEEDSYVEVLAVEGNKLVVKKIK